MDPHVASLVYILSEAKACKYLVGTALGLTLDGSLHELPGVCSVLQCVAVCCSVVQCVAVCCKVLQGVACVAVCCSVLQ